MTELKIVIRSKDGILDATETIVYLNDEPVGCIQDLKIHLNAYQINPTVEITFPELKSEDIDPSNDNEIFSLPLIVKENIECFSSIPNVKVNVKQIEFNFIDEIGTMGHIEKLKLR